MGPARSAVALAVVLSFASGATRAETHPGAVTRKELSRESAPEDLWLAVVEYKASTAQWKKNAKNCGAALREESKKHQATRDVSAKKSKAIDGPPIVVVEEKTPSWVAPTVVLGSIAAVALVVASFLVGESRGRKSAHE